MNEDVKAKWVAALRSGEYKQGSTFLHNIETNTLCCLGVLCEIAVEEGVVVGSVTNQSSVMAYDGGWAVPPKSVVEWAGLDGANPCVPDEAAGKLGRPALEEWSLAELNDSGLYSFDDIADVIEQFV